MTKSKLVHLVDLQCSELELAFRTVSFWYPRLRPGKVHAFESLLDSAGGANKIVYLVVSTFDWLFPCRRVMVGLLLPRGCGQPDALSVTSDGLLGHSRRRATAKASLRTFHTNIVSHLIDEGVETSV